MFQFNIIKRLSQKPLIVLAALVLAVVAAGGSTRSAAADGPLTPSSMVTTRTFAANERFVTHLYQDALGRNPDRASLAQTVAALERGTSRYQVATNVLISGE